MKFLLCLTGLLCSFPLFANQTISVAVAGGVRPAMIDIQKAFEKKTGDTLQISYASVGMLYAQIQQGAKLRLNGEVWSVVTCLFADDIVLLAESEGELQRVVNEFYSGCKRRRVRE